MFVKLSVIIPCYNNGKYLAEMLDCCIRQTFKEWEVIVVDDISTDNTPDIVKSYAKKDERIKFFQRNRQPKGSVVCRNIGFDLSSGEYIIHFDADDLISDTCFEKRVAYMESHLECDYASFPAVLFYDAGKIPEWGKGKIEYGITSKKGNILHDFLSARFPFSCWCNIYRREAIKNIRWDENILVYSDFSYIIPCIFANLKHQFSGLQEYDYYYRQFVNGSNMCASFTSEGKCRSTLYLFEKTQEMIQTRNDKDKLLNYYLIWTIIHYERLLLSGNISNINDFYHAISKYYDRGILLKCRIAKELSSIANEKVRIFLVDLVLGILFVNKRLFKKSIKAILGY